MLKWASKSKDGSRPVLGFGLEAKNIELLKAGRPIIAKVSISGVECDVVIHYGETAAKIFTDLEAAGVALPATNVTPLPQVH